MLVVTPFIASSKVTISMLHDLVAIFLQIAGRAYDNLLSVTLGDRADSVPFVRLFLSDGAIQKGSKVSSLVLPTN